MLSFYIEVENNRYYWTGKKFTEYEDQAMTYKLNKPKAFIKANLDKLPQVKQMLKLDSSLFDDIKIE